MRNAWGLKFIFCTAIILFALNGTAFAYSVGSVGGSDHYRFDGISFSFDGDPSATSKSSATYYGSASSNHYFDDSSFGWTYDLSVGADSEHSALAESSVGFGIKIVALEAGYLNLTSDTASDGISASLDDGAYLEWWYPSWGYDWTVYDNDGNQVDAGYMIGNDTGPAVYWDHLSPSPWSQTFSLGQIAYMEEGYTMDFGYYSYLALDLNPHKDHYSATPVPAPMLLLGTGLVGLVGFRKTFRGNNRSN